MKKPPNPIDQAVGKNIRKRRQLASTNQEKLGNACEITFQQIQKYEKGANRVGSSRLVQIADALKCSVGDLFEGVSSFETTKPENTATFRIDQINLISSNSLGQAIFSVPSRLIEGLGL